MSQYVAAQLSLVASLLMNWDGIRLHMEPMAARTREQMSIIAAGLQSAESPDQIASLVDDLLDVTRDTPAYEYVRDLVARSAVPPEATTRDSEAAPFPKRPNVLWRVRPSPASVDLEAADLDASRKLGSVISVDSGIARVPIFFATNRAQAAQGKAIFSGEPAAGISYGVSPVTIPVAKHRIGKVETPHWWTLFPDSDPEHRFVTLEGTEILEQPAFATRLETLLHDSGVEDLLIFLHGYNVTFEEGARRAAQIAYDMQFPGAVILFSWPSAGSAAAYPKDEESAFASAGAFAAFLKSLEGGPWQRVHVLAHSMGNRVMLLGLADNPRPKLPLGQVVFTAADVYVPLFLDKFPRLLEAGALPATSYASSRDLALRLSSMLHRGARVGLISGSPFVDPPLDTVDASAVDTGFLGHGYFSEKRSLITDLRLLLYQSLSPKDRGLMSVENYWQFPK